MGFKQHISRTLQMIEQQVNDVPFRPHHEAPRQVKVIPSLHIKRMQAYFTSLSGGQGSI